LYLYLVTFFIEYLYLYLSYIKNVSYPALPRGP